MRGDLDEARRRRLDVLDFYGESPDDPFAVAARVVLAGEAGDPRRRPRRGRAALPGGHRGLRAARPAGHELDVPRHGRRLRRAGRRLPGRDQDAGGGDRDQRVAARRASPDRCWPASAGCCSTTASWRGPRRSTSGRSSRPAGCGTPMVLFQAQAGLAVAAPARTDGTTPPSRPPPRRWSCYRADGFRRFRNRVDPTTDLAGRGRGVLRGARRDRRRTGRTGTGGDAARTGRAPARPSRASRSRRSSTTT